MLDLYDQGMNLSYFRKNGSFKNRERKLKLLPGQSRIPIRFLKMYSILPCIPCFGGSCTVDKEHNCLSNIFMV